MEKSGRGRGWVGLDKAKGILHVYFIFRTLSMNEAYKKCDILENCWEDWELNERTEKIWSCAHHHDVKS